MGDAPAPDHILISLEVALGYELYYPTFTEPYLLAGHIQGVRSGGCWGYATGAVGVSENNPSETV